MSANIADPGFGQRPSRKTDVKLTRPDLFNLFTALWCTQVQSYKEYRNTVKFFTLDYKDLLANPENEMRNLLDHCEMANIASDVSTCLKAMDKDSQSGSVLSKKNLKGSKKEKLSEEQLDLIQSIMSRFDFPALEDYKELFK